MPDGTVALPGVTVTAKSVPGFGKGFMQGFTWKNFAIGLGIGVGVSVLEAVTGGAATPFIVAAGGALLGYGAGTAGLNIISSKNPAYTAGVYAGGAASGMLGGAAGGGAVAGFNSLAAETAAAAENPIYVLGRQVDTAVAKNWPGHSILDIPDWTLAKNDAFVQNIIDQRATVYLGSPQTEATLFDAANNRMTVFARELEQLKAAGYKQAGDYMLPPGTH
jgi:hypothetical protein